MEIKWLKDFLALSSEGNFRIAAHRRNVSQPAFSRRIQALEAWIGAPLIDRSGQPAQLTMAGKLFLPVAQKIVALATTVKQDIQTQVLEDKNRMNFATVSTLAEIFIPGWLRNLRPFIDSTQFVVRTDFKTVEDYFTALDDNVVDFFVCYEDPEHRFHADETVFSSLKLGREALIPVVSPNSDGTPRWWLPDGPGGQIPCLHALASGSPSPIRHHMGNRYRNHSFKTVYESSIAPTLKAMAIEGFGLAWIPSAHLVEDLAAGRLVRAAQPVDDIRVDIRIFRSLKHSEPRADKFWDVLLHHKMPAASDPVC